MPRRFQFSLKTLLVAILVVAAFFGGVEWQRRRAGPQIVYGEQMMGTKGYGIRIDSLTLPDGSRWLRPISEGSHAGKIEFYENGARISLTAE
ncbi:MAG TPA: hypothetical protein VGN42_18550 [Pirellulales bacterium]|jgi:hypothetical protein|nr:hypothetical protein [Pirellulales bacterium]